MEFKNEIGSKSVVSEEIQEPPQFRVILLNDDYTTKDFVVSVLISVFHKTSDDAHKIMENVHNKGRGIVGVYTYDIAATCCLEVHDISRQNGFPLRCIMEQI
ncbi:ATP-dependent Clp protease adaptor ClpS [Brucepastera parasyntrophica]|uniref:ATP-dependent Clp protease adaptor ClpS n=1 Tax=Brucepastera parasyntrophica TaxID=2880008 RepID=UPI00210EFEFC|nr:ATP-dependent Clp protease adaptor ClpS [Brucepastera parasyntrophica]ULQ59349.1 ATP-dependent Clp protease adaptor ClpS [Brucepastera parasyntrophica]